MELADECEYYCNEQDCINCPIGNPCLNCPDYDRKHDTCKSDGACGKEIFL